MSRRQTAVYEHRRHGHGSSDCARKLGADPRLSCANCHPQRGSRESGPLREASAGYRACPSKRRVLSIRAADACGSRQRMYCSIVNNSRAMRPHCPYRNRSARLERLPESEVRHVSPKRRERRSSFFKKSFEMLIRSLHNPKEACAEAAKDLDQIRRIVAINLMLGLLTVIVGASGRFW